MDANPRAPFRLQPWLAAAAIALGLAAAARPALAQVDPLLSVKRVPPTVIIVFDTSFRMLDDGNGNYYDPYTYAVAGDPVATAAGVTSGTRYRRIYRNLRFTSATNSKYEADTVVGVSDVSANYSKFWDATRYEIARRGVSRAIGESGGTSAEETGGWAPRWGVLRLRQSNPAWATGCDKPVDVTGNAAFAGVSDTLACGSAGAGRLGIFAPTVSAASYSNTASAPAGTFVADPTVAAQVKASYASAVFATGVSTNSYLVPAGRDGVDYADRPIRLALVDALEKAKAAVTADTAAMQGCRNTVVVLVTGGQDDGDATYRSGNVSAQAALFRAVNVGGSSRRMPIFVVAVKPLAADEGELRDIAAQSGGRYFRTTTTEEVQRAVDLAIQSGYTNRTDFDQSAASEYVLVSPIVGTVNLKNARDWSGSLLPDTQILNGAGNVVPQRSNMIVTAGFTLGGPAAGATGDPGFEGRVRAFRSFKPQTDATKPTGYKFISDGTPLWPLASGDDRAALAGIARTPSDPGSRNVFTYVPGVGTITFSMDHAGVLAPHLGGADATQLIPFVRSLPIGAVIGSTPALMDPPSLDPPPDAEYGTPYTESDATYAGKHRDRRSIIWFGANDGMIHGVDARTGYEVWAFIPFNLLPKLKTLMDGQPVHQFEYFVDSSPKIAEVKMSGEWKSLLLIGQGPGGTFYQAFDVTEAGMGGPLPESDDYQSVLATFADPNRVRFLWSFPDYAQFDTDLATSGTSAAFVVTDATPGGRVRLYGDIKATANAVEKSVGFTWSDPAVGTLTPDRSINVAIVGSGYFPDLEGALVNRKIDSTIVRAGRSFYLVDLSTGRVFKNPSACGTNAACFDVGNVANPPWKNALQADPTAAGTAGDYVVKKAYMGDLAGRYWRFNFNQTGTITATALISTGQPIYNSSALLLVGTTEQYVFFSTGSDMLPRLAAAGGDSGPYKLYGIRDLGTSASTTFSYSLGWPGGSGKNQTSVMERPSASPSVAGDIVFFTTTLEDTAAYCTSTSVQGRLYAFTYQGGAAYDTNGTGSLDKNDTGAVKTVSGRATAPFIVDQHLYFATSGPNGPSLEVFGNPEDFNNGVGQVGVRILSWRELR